MKIDKNDLESICRAVRYKLAEVSCKTGTPHLGSCLSAVELLVTLYWQYLRIEPSTLADPNRDYFLLGKGHAASLLYTVLAYRGFYEPQLLLEHGKDNSMFEEHPGMKAPPGVETPSGSLGHALSLATGMALTTKIKNMQNQFYVLVGDGELNEGTNWEAAMFAAKHKLDNLVLVVDFNKLQGTGRSCDIMELEFLDAKFSAFGWHVERINGHNLDEINTAYNSASSCTGKPSVIVADTLKGAGVSFMEDDNNWHYRIPTLEELDVIAQELNIQ
jgi:transketolase